MKAILRVERQNLKAEIPEFRVGDTVRVHVKVVEGDKVRSQVFQGTVIGRRGGGIRETFKVRKISNGVAVERLFPTHSPNLILIERVTIGKVRRAQLTYMRDRKGKAARIAGRRLGTEFASAAEVLEAVKAADLASGATVPQAAVVKKGAPKAKATVKPATKPAAAKKKK
jgi:large subunit ribosomal protein L19